MDPSCISSLMLLIIHVSMVKSLELAQIQFPYSFIIHAFIQQRFIKLLLFAKHYASHKSARDIFPMSKVITDC